MNTLAKESRSRHRRPRLVLGAWFSIVLAAGGGAAFAEQERYTYFRSLEGPADLTSQDGARAEAEANYPILAGDRLELGANARADVLLADGSQLTVDGGSELVFDDLAFSADGPAKGNVLRLLAGRIYLDSHGGWRGDHDQPVVDTQNARVYLQADGVYVVTASERGYTEVTVRDGFAEVVDQRGSSIARAGESVEVTGDQDPRAQVLAARSETEVEAWAREQEARHGRGSDPNLEQPLESTATLANHGDWLEVDSRRAWRPYVSVKTWRPYNNGRWAHTPRGLYWVSSDPWSPVVYHYGSWEYDLYHGWIWYPGYSWRPAHVYWYWGPSYTAWVPIGYYSRHYRGFYPGYGLRSGVYGWVGGRWDPFYDWTFCPSAYLRHRRPHHYYRSGRDFAHHDRLDRGILTTDTGYLGRDQWHRPELVRVALERGWQSERGGELQDVSQFVDRPGQLPENVARQVLLKPNPTSRGFDERVAAVLPRSGRGASAGTETVDGSGTRQGLGGQEAASPAAGVDRRTQSRPGEGDSNRPARAVSVDQTAPRSAPGARQTVSREGADQPQPGSVTRSGSGQLERGTPSVTRTAVPRDRPDPGSSTDRRTSVQRAPVPRADATPAPAAPVSRPGVTRQGVDTPREPARRVLDGIRGRSRPSSGGGEVGTPAARPTVQRSPVPRSGVSPATPRAPSSTGARQPVSRPSAGAGNEAPRRPVATTPPSRSGGTASQSSASGRATVQRSPVATTPASRSSNAASQSSASGRAPVQRSPVATPPSATRPSSSASRAARQPVRTPSRPSYSSPSTAARPSATTQPSSGSRYPSSGARASGSSSRPTPAVRPPSAGTSRPAYSAPSRPTTSSQRAPSSTQSPPATSSRTPRVSTPPSRQPSPSASRAPASSRPASDGARSTASSSSRSSGTSRATTSSSRATSRPSSSRPNPDGSR